MAGRCDDRSPVPADGPGDCSIEEIAGDYDGQAVVGKVNVDLNPNVSARFGIRSIPTLLFIPMDGEPQMAQGAMPKASFKEAIEKVLLKK